ncbi:MAG TPA: AMP-dependent synthetase/ligase [Geminicoccaceae bacterium]|nr:AMP-dependent synthetase/ligase [Geminicoccaceae bacterium]
MATPDFGANLLDMFFAAAARGGDRPFLWAKREGAYRPWSWRRVADEVRALARALTASGFAPGDRAVIVAENRPEWLIADLAVMAAGGVTVPAYTTNAIGDHAYILNHSGATAVVCSGRRTIASRLLPALREAGGVALVLAMDPLEEGADGPPASIRVLGWPEALALGERDGAGAEERAARLGRDDTACFIYTSGTGGRPKGVMLSHGNVLANVRGAYGLLEALGVHDDVFLSFLPLSHAYEHTAGQFFPIAIGAQIYYAESAETLATNLLEARPTIMMCVPRLYEILRQRMTHTVDRQGGLRARLFHRALELGRRRYADPRSLGPLDRALDLALERLVRDKVRARFGGRIKALVSGGAPLSYEVGLFFTALGLPVFQGYGQTEAAPVISCNPPGRVKLHTVGPPLAGVGVRIAADGEILVRGELVMKGYWRDEAETGRALRDGWLHTGDVGYLDGDGYLVITDRKKDIIINSGGDNVAPQRVEGVLTLQPEIGQAVVYGDRRPNLVALIVPDAEFLRGYARQNGAAPDLAVLAGDAGFRRRLDQALERANRELSQIERVRRYHVVSEPFSVDDGTMTPTLKLKRQVIYRRYADVLEGLYAAGGRG